MNNFIDTLNAAASAAIGFAPSMLLQTTLLIFLLLGVDFILRRRVRAVVRYAVWLLLLIKLILPPSLALPTGIGYWLGARRNTTPITAGLDTPRVRMVALPVTEQKTDSQFTASVTRKLSLRPESWLLTIWSGGALALLLVLIRRSRAIRWKIAAARTAPEALVELLAKCGRQLRLRSLPQLRLTDTTMSPAVCGLWRPVILLPSRLVEKLSEAQLRAVLLHELAHIQRADVWVNYAQTLLQIFYWWHPLLWLANARIRRVREEAVDELVMVELGREAESYPVTLIEVAKLTLSRTVLSLGLVGILESKSALKQRVHRLVNYPTPRSARLNFVSLLVCAMLGAAVLPMARGQRGEPAKQSKPANAGEAGGEQPFVSATGHFVLLPKKKIEAMMLPRTAPSFSTFGVKGWPIAKREFDALMVRAEGLGGYVSGTDTALLTGFEGLTRSGKRISLGITTQLLNTRSPEGKWLGEARVIPSNLTDLSEADIQTAGDSRIHLIPTVSKEKTRLELQAICTTYFSEKLADGSQLSSTKTNFTFSAKLDQPADRDGVVFVCDQSKQYDGRVLIVLLSTRPRAADEVNGQGVIRISANGQFALNGEVKTLDQLGAALFHEQQKFFRYGVWIEKEPEAKDDDLEKVKERLRWLKIDDVRIGEATNPKAEMNLKPSIKTPTKVVNHDANGKEFPETLVGYEVASNDRMQPGAISKWLTNDAGYRSSGRDSGVKVHSVYVPLGLEDGSVPTNRRSDLDREGIRAATAMNALAGNQAAQVESQPAAELPNSKSKLDDSVRASLKDQIQSVKLEERELASERNPDERHHAQVRQVLKNLEKTLQDLDNPSATPKSVSIQAKFISAPTAASFNKLTFGRLVATNESGVSTWLMSAQELTTIWSLARKTAGFEILAKPQITTTDGREAAMFVGALTDNAPLQILPGGKPKMDGSVFSMNAIGYVNVLKPDDKEIEEDILIGPSLRVLPKIVGSEIDLSVGAKITESPARTNFRANAHGTVSDGGGLLIIGKSTTANHGTNYAVIVSATMGEKFPSSRR